MSQSPQSLALAPHSRLRVDLRLGRMGTLTAALAADPQLFSHPLPGALADNVGSVGELLLRDAILSCHAPLNQALVTFLLSNGAATPQRLPQALSLAVSMGDMPVVERLQAAGWSPDLRDDDGGNALEIAAYRAMAPLIQRWRSYLPGAPDKAGQTLFHHLCRADLWTGGAQAAMETAMYLIRAGVDWQKVDNSGASAADLCRYPDTAAAIEEAWKDHRAAMHRSALGKLAQQHAPAATPAAPPRSRRM